MKETEYLVIPFEPTVSPKETYGVIANQVHELLVKYGSEGWEFLRIDNVKAKLKGNLLYGDTQKIDAQIMIFKRRIL